MANNKLEIFAGILDNTGPVVNSVATMDGMAAMFPSNKDAFTLIHQGSQVVASASGVLTIVKATSGLIPFANMATNTWAGTITLLRITAHWSDPNRKVEVGDLLSLTGNALGVAASMVILAGASASVVGAVGVTVTAASLWQSGTLRAIYDKIIDPLFVTYFRDNPSANYWYCRVSPRLTMATDPEIEIVFHDETLMCLWDPATGDVSPAGTYQQNSTEVLPVPMPAGYITPPRMPAPPPWQPTPPAPVTPNPPAPPTGGGPGGPPPVVVPLPPFTEPVPPGEVIIGQPIPMPGCRTNLPWPQCL